MIAFIGVRSSCDMLARKLDLVWLAASAASRACCIAVSACLRAVTSSITAQNCGSPFQSSAITLTSASNGVPSKRQKRHSQRLHALAAMRMCWRISSSARSRLVRPSACSSGESGGNHSDAAEQLRSGRRRRTAAAAAGLQCVMPRWRSNKT